VTEEKAPATIRKRLLVMVGIIALVSGGVWQYPNIKRTIKNAILDRKIEAAYQDYMAAHPDPCDNMFLAYEAAKKYVVEWRQNNSKIHPSRQTIVPNFTDKKESYYYQQVDKTTKLTKFVTYNDYYRENSIHSYLGDCRHEFYDSYSTIEIDDMIGGKYHAIVKYEDGEWEKEFVGRDNAKESK